MANYVTSKDYVDLKVEEATSGGQEVILGTVSISAQTDIDISGAHTSPVTTTLATLSTYTKIESAKKYKAHVKGTVKLEYKATSETGTGVANAIALGSNYTQDVNEAIVLPATSYGNTQEIPIDMFFVALGSNINAQTISLTTETSADVTGANLKVDTSSLNLYFEEVTEDSLSLFD